MTEVIATNETILVVGGGISGMTAALEAAETGKRVVLVEKRPYLGGARFPVVQIFPQIVFPNLRAGDQSAPRQDEPQPHCPDDGRGHGHLWPVWRLHRDGQTGPALCQRALYGVWCLWRGRDQRV
ncbi:hypothetical protein CCP4SC76_1560001 [Gammaproteobacteria bacterium]